MIQEFIHSNGVVGQLFIPDQPRYAKTLTVVLGGSSGGLRHASVAQRLADDGVDSFALAYFGVDGLPPKLDGISLEYFFKAFSLLLNRDEFSGYRLVCLGHSRGAELALQLAANSTSIAGVIATSPSHVRWGATGSNKPAWLLDGKPLPFVDPVAVPDSRSSMLLHNGQEYASYCDWYLYQLEHSPNLAEAAIPVENIHCPVLLFSGQDDRLWPSALSADVIEQKRRAVSKPVENVQYKDVGHVIPLPGETRRLFAWHDAVKAGIAYGGSHDASVSAGNDRWKRILAFLESIENPDQK